MAWQLLERSSTKTPSFQLLERDGRSVTPKEPSEPRVPASFSFLRSALDELTSPLPLRRLPQLFRATRAIGQLRAGDPELASRIAARERLKLLGETQHPIATGLGQAAGMIPAFALGSAATAPLRALPWMQELSRGGALARLLATGSQLGAVGGAAELIQGRPEHVLPTTALMTAGAPAGLVGGKGVAAVAKRFLAGGIPTGLTAAAMAPPGERARSGAFGTVLGGVGGALSRPPAVRPALQLQERLPGASPYSFLLPGEGATASEAAAAAREAMGGRPPYTPSSTPLRTAAELAMERPIRGPIDLPESALTEAYRARYPGALELPPPRPAVEYPPGRIPRTRTAEGGFALIPEEESVRKAAVSAARTAPIFYSRLERTIEERMPNAAPADQVRGILRSAGVNQEELKWLDLDTYLAQKPKVTKQEVLDYIRANNVQVQEVVKGVPSPRDAGSISTETKFRSYQLPGGTNYRELLLTVPEKTPSVSFNEWLAHRVGEERVGELSQQDLVAARREFRDLGNAPGTFRSPHFDEPNVLAHVRFSDRVDAQGKNVLYADEIQSDWHQKGRKHGYKMSPQERLKLQDEATRLMERGNSLAQNGRERGLIGSGREVILQQDRVEYDSLTRQYENITDKLANTSVVPDAPFKKTWPDLIMKRMIRWAAEHDYDKLAWTTGEQQAARYDLSKQIRKLEWNRQTRAGEQVYFIKAYPHEGRTAVPIIDEGNIRPGELDNYVGKEIAQRIIADAEHAGGDIVGLDLKVGGEGMKGFYDQLLPNKLNNYAKKWGGRVTETTLPLPGDLTRAEISRGVQKPSAKVHSLDITPSMKQAVLKEGQPLWEGGYALLPSEEEAGAVGRAAARGAVAMGIGEAANPTRSQEQQGRVTRILDALKESKPIRKEQEALYARERSARLAKMQVVRGKVGGEEGLYRELGTLKGPLPRPQFETLRGKLQEADVNGLLDDLNASSLNPWEILNAKVGVMKLFGEFGGEVPTKGEIALLEKVFGSDLPNELLRKQPAIHKWGLEALNLPRAVMAGLGDLSALFRQGIFYLPRHPARWTQAAVKSIRMFGSEKAFRASQQEISSRRTYSLMQEHGLALTDIDVPLTQREELFMGTPLLEKVPVIGKLARATNRAYVGFLNRMRADIFDSYVRTGERFGLIDKDPLYLPGAATQVNNATGRGNLRIPLIGRALAGSEALERAAPILNATLFSPRLVASRLNLLDPTYYLTLPKHVRKEAIKDLIAFAGTGVTTLGLLKASGHEVGADWRSADFGKVKVGNTRYDLFGGFLQPTVAAARLITGQMVSSTTGREFQLGEGYKPTTRADIAMRFLASKQSPLARFATGLLQGTTGAGEKFEIAPELVSMFIPMVMQDLYEVTQEHGPTRWWMGLPTVVGIGVQTYGRTIPNIEPTPSGRPTVRFRPTPELGEAIVSSVTGKRRSNVPERLHRPLSDLNLSLQIHKADVDKAKAQVRRDGKRQVVRDAYGETVIWQEQGITKTKTTRRKQTPSEAVADLQKLGQFR